MYAAIGWQRAVDQLARLAPTFVAQSPVGILDEGVLSGFARRDVVLFVATAVRTPPNADLDFNLGLFSHTFKFLTLRSY